MSMFLSVQFAHKVHFHCKEWTIVIISIYFKVENPGIDPGASRMQSERSSI